MCEWLDDEGAGILQGSCCQHALAAGILHRQAEHNSSRPKQCLVCQGYDGTLWHKRCQCDSSEAKRLECASLELRVAAKAAKELSDETVRHWSKDHFPDSLTLPLGQPTVTWLKTGGGTGPKMAC